MPSRRHHKKSRHGCTRCKMRRVKCDGQRPICGNCVRREETCVQALDGAPATSVAYASPVPNDSSESSNAARSTTELNLRNLELIHHYSTVVAATFSKDPRISRMWSTSVPKEGLSNPYLMHGVLAISALHLAHTSLNCSDDYRAIAIRHHDIALAGLRPLLTQVTRENCAALCASATLTVMFCAASFSDRSPQPTPLDGILEVCQFARGVRVVAETGLAWLLTGAMEPLMHYPDIGTAPPLNHDMQQALTQLRHFIMRDDNVSTSYLDALTSLSGNFCAVAAKSDHPALCLTWLVMIDRTFVEMLQQEAPLAMLIVAHFGVLLNIGADLWFIRSWGRQIVQYVYEKLPPEWRYKMAWPARKVEFYIPEEDIIMSKGLC